MKISSLEELVLKDHLKKDIPTTKEELETALVETQQMFAYDYEQLRYLAAFDQAWLRFYNATKHHRQTISLLTRLIAEDNEANTLLAICTEGLDPNALFFTKAYDYKKSAKAREDYLADLALNTECRLLKNGYGVEIGQPWKNNNAWLIPGKNTDLEEVKQWLTLERVVFRTESLPLLKSVAGPGVFAD